MEQIKQDLKEWLVSKKIQHEILDDTVIIDGFGEMFIFNTDKVSSVFKKIKGVDDVEFNSYEPLDELLSEGINYICLKFGLYWYYFDIRETVSFKPLQCIGNKTPTRRKEELVNLGVHTSYELLNSSVHIDELVAAAKWHGHKSVGICDVNTMAATYPLQKSAKGIRYAFGYSTAIDYNETIFRCKLYPKNKNGLRNLLRIQKIVNVDHPGTAMTFEEFTEYASDMFFVFAKDSVNILCDPGRKKIVFDILDLIDPDSVFYQFDISEYRANEVDVEALKNAQRYIREVYCNTENEFIPPVLLTDVFYIQATDSKSKITLNKIATGGAHDQSYDHYYKDVDDHYDQMLPLFGGLEEEGFSFDEFFSYVCENSVYIADSCDVKFDNDRMFMPVYPMKPEEIEKYGDRLTMFNELLEDGFKRLVPAGKEEVYRERLEKEKYVLKSTNSVDYFLIYYDLCNWCRENDILMAYGRGSAGGCLISYLLGLIKIDPIKYDLIFERFLIPERAGLNDEDATIADKVECCDFYEVYSDNGSIKISSDSTVIVERDGNKIIIPICEVMVGDNILFDNIHEIWDIDNK